MIYKSTEGVTSCKDMEKRTKLHETSHHQPLLVVLQTPLVAPLDGGTAVLIKGDRQGVPANCGSQRSACMMTKVSGAIGTDAPCPDIRAQGGKLLVLTVPIIHAVRVLVGLRLVIG